MLSGRRLLYAGGFLAVWFLTAVILTASSSVSKSYWQQQFDRWPAGFAHSASYYGIGEASHWLGDVYWRQEKRSVALGFYRRAVAQGDAGAAYALSVHVPAHREHWLNAAAELGDRGASLLVAEALFEHAPERSFTLLEQLPSGEHRDEMVARLALNHPHLSETFWQDLAPDSLRWAARRKTNEWLMHLENEPCEYPVSVLNSAPTGREAFLDWMTEWRRSALQDFPMCFYFEPQINPVCQVDEGRADCAAVDSSRFSLQWFIAPQGRANARPQALYLSASSTFSVLQHELAHWFGLADEYPMSAPLAEHFCSGRYNFEARNIVITDSTTVTESELENLQNSLPWLSYIEQPIAQKSGPNQYTLGSTDISKVGLFPARTCADTDFYAWKPVAELTFMEQHDIGSVPRLYLELMSRGTEEQASGR